MSDEIKVHDALGIFESLQKEPDTTPGEPAPKAAQEPALPEGQITPQDVPPDASPPLDRSRATEKAPPSSREMASQFRNLLNKERELREKESQLQAYDEQLRRARELEQLAKDNPAAFLNRVGVPYDQFAQGAVNESRANWLRKMQDIESKWLETQQRLHQMEEERIQAQRAHHVQAYVESSVDAFPLVNALGAYDAVLAQIRDSEHSPEGVMTEHEAAAHIETQLGILAQKLLAATKRPEEVRNQPVSAPPPSTPRPSYESPGTLRNTHATEGRVSNDHDSLPEHESIRILAEKLTFE